VRNKKRFKSLATFAHTAKATHDLREAEKKQELAREAQTLMEKVKDYTNRIENLTPVEVQAFHDDYVALEGLYKKMGLEGTLKPSAEVFA
jgi:hypothetical protein